MSCPICNTPSANTKPPDTRDVTLVTCQRCGEFSISRQVLVNLEKSPLENRQRANISGWLVENKGHDINDTNIKDLIRITPPSFSNKADRLLLYMAKESKYPGSSISYSEYFISHAWCIHSQELDTFIGYLEELKYIDIRHYKYKISPNGWIRLEKIRNSNAKSLQGFVAMWFDPDMKSLYDDAIAPAIRDAGYEPHRVDLREHNDKIDDEIIAQIRRSKFVIADFTGHRGGVYFEAGFAKGLGLEVFWLCKEDELSDLHFDIRQYNCITWSDEKKEELRRKLSLRIESVLGQGPNSA